VSCTLVFSVLLSATACHETATPQEPVRSRFDAVKAAPGALQAKWCDLVHEGAGAPAPDLPRTEPPAPPLPRGRWIWLNFWATWCAPCVRELPLLARWRELLEHDGVPVDVWMISLDEDAADVAKFVSAHRDVVPKVSLRVAETASMDAWTKTQGLDAASSIPIHALVAPDGRVRCVRAGSLAEGDFHLVRSVLRAR